MSHMCFLLDACESIIVICVCSVRASQRSDGICRTVNAPEAQNNLDVFSLNWRKIQQAETNMNQKCVHCDFLHKGRKEEAAVFMSI